MLGLNVEYNVQRHSGPNRGHAPVRSATTARDERAPPLQYDQRCSMGLRVGGCASHNIVLNFCCMTFLLVCLG